MNWKRDFNWAGAVERNREALKGIIAALFTLLGLDGTDAVSRIPPVLHRAVLRVLQARRIRRAAPYCHRGPGPCGEARARASHAQGADHVKGSGSRLPSFQLFDPRKSFPQLRQRRVRYTKNPPRIHVFPYDTLVPEPGRRRSPPPPDGLVNAERISRRLQALKLALDDLPRQAKRLARATARREKVPTPKFQSPLRPGRPPGSRRKPTHEVDEILANCHWLAWEAEKLDTS